MVDYFIAESGSSSSGFYLHDYDRLLTDINALKATQKKVIVWGVTFALLDLAERYEPDLSHCLVFETGGMKGRRKEVTREELHGVLKKKFNVDRVHSEYGMTEMLSQAYTMGGNIFLCPPWLKVITRDITDPLERGIEGSGGLNIIDLANLWTVSFLETEDLGKVKSDGSFEVIGRMDNRDIRGCNLLIE